MILPNLPPKGSTDWYAHYTAVDDAVRQIATVELNVRNYGATGNGATDDTASIQSAIVACPQGCALYFPPGVYIINSTITINKSVTLFGNAATLKCGSSPAGDLLNIGRHISINASDVIVRNLHFGTPGATLSKPSTMSTINIENSARVVITRCKFTGPNIGGIRVAGPGSVDCVISYNQIESSVGGIIYSDGGASRTQCINNLIDGSDGNALSGAGNDPTHPNIGCIVMNNVIANYGRIGIEDWNNCEETRIIGNRISGAGQTAEGIAISAVGWRPFVEENVITDFQTVGIEVKGIRATIRGNTVTQKNASLRKTGTAVVVNGSSVGYVMGGSVTDNIIDNCDIGISAWADCGPVNIVDNTLRNCVTGVSAMSSNSGTVVQATGNTFYYSDIHSTNRRISIDLYSSSADGLRGSSIISNRIFYDTSAGNSTGGDWSVKIVANGVLVSGNTFDGGNVATPALGAPGVSNTGVVVINNRFMRGAGYNLAGYVTPVDNGNIVS